MSFDYDKVAHKDGDHGSWWTSYADLFMMLSIVFLLMYVASSLRQGSAGFHQQQEYKRLSQKAEDLEQQIKAYNTLKDEALKQQTNQAEQDVYKKLMDRLNLLQDEARNEKDALRKKAKENEEKEFALNQYQQLVRNIINANVLANSQINRRDLIIVSKNATIEEKKAKIAEMERIVTENELKINSINSQLDAKIAELTAEQERSQSSKSELEQKIMLLKQDSKEQINSLQSKNQDITQQLSQVKGTLSQTQTKLTAANVTIEQQQAENTSLSAKLESDRKRYLNELEGLQAQHKAKLAAERAAFERGLKSQRLTAAAKAKKLQQYLAAEKGKAAALEGHLSGLRSKIKDTEAQLAGAEAEKGRALAEKGQAEAEKGRALAEKNAALAEKGQALAEKGRALAAAEGLKSDLEKTRAIANARKVLAKKVGDTFAAAGVKGKVDARTGEVTLDFGEEYFDTGSVTLKPQMRTTLDKFVPLYAQSLFNDPNVASKIGSVEIVGFASSTFKGKYVNPKSARPEDKAALDYNLKLSFGRANSIFQHIFSKSKLDKTDRDRLMPMIKVVGRGYLPEGATAADIPNDMTEAEFCAKYNCKKAQRVVVKFNMKD